MASSQPHIHVAVILQPGSEEVNKGWRSGAPVAAANSNAHARLDAM